jgi:methyl-accepting chemotaxis protein
MTLKVKLILVFALAMAGVVVLSMSTHLTLQRNIVVAESVKSEKLKTVLLAEKLAALSTALITGIQASVNSASEDGLEKADRAEAEILASLTGPATGSVAPKIAEQLAGFPDLVAAAKSRGTALAMAVIDQEFAEIPAATEAFGTAAKVLKTAVVSVQHDAEQGLARALDEMVVASVSGARIGFWIACALVAAMIGLLVFLVLAVIRPIGRVVERLKDIAQGEGDLTRRMPEERGDEIGDLARWFNLFLEKLHVIIRDITGGAETLRFSSGMLVDLSGAMASSVDAVTRNAGELNNDTDAISTNINSVASAMEQATTNINLIASSAEEMSSTIGEIARNTEAVRGKSAGAVSQARTACDKIAQLGEAVNRIGKVSETIGEISEQTNLLALNATIEAARAGESGKGFAVVANEIKELASQTAEATREIAAQIQDIQSSAGGSVEEVEAITVTIGEVDDVIGAIAGSIEEQSAVTKEIAGSVAHASQGINEVNTAIAGSADGVERIATQVSGIHEAAGDMAHRCSQSNLSAEDLVAIARQIDALVNQFRLRPAKFDMGRVKGAHLNWRYKLNAAISGHQKLGSDEVPSHEACEFGQWIALKDGGQALKEEPSFEAVCRTHQQVHRIAREVIASSNNGRGQQLADLMHTFEETRQRFFDALETLYR